MILKVRNKNGEWVSIGSVQGEKGADGTMSFEDLTEEQKESLKGEPGDDYILTDADKQEIAQLVEVPEVNLNNYYTKSEVDNLISAIPTYSDGDEVNY